MYSSWWNDFLTGFLYFSPTDGHGVDWWSVGWFGCPSLTLEGNVKFFFYLSFLGFLVLQENPLMREVLKILTCIVILRILSCNLKLFKNIQGRHNTRNGTFLFVAILHWFNVRNSERFKNDFFVFSRCTYKYVWNYSEISPNQVCPSERPFRESGCNWISKPLIGQLWNI